MTGQEALRIGYEVLRFPDDGTIDADGHVLEPADLWHELPRGRLPSDAPSGCASTSAGSSTSSSTGGRRTAPRPASLGLHGRDGRPRPPGPVPTAGTWTTCRSAPATRPNGSSCSTQEHLDSSVLYPTIGMLWECEVTDPELIDRLHARLQPLDRRLLPSDSGGRLVPIAHLTLLDPEAAAAELERAVADGCRGRVRRAVHAHAKAHGHPDHDVLCATAVALGVPIGIHPTYEPDWAAPVRVRHGVGAPARVPLQRHAAPGRAAGVPLVLRATARSIAFPTLRLGVLEAGSGWIGSFLDRMDAVRDTISASGAHARRPAERLLPPPVLHLGRPRRDGRAADHRPRRRGPLPVGDRLPAPRPSRRVGASPRAIRGAARPGVPREGAGRERGAVHRL